MSNDDLVSVVVPTRDLAETIRGRLGDLRHEIIVRDVPGGLREARGDVIVTAPGDLQAIPEMVARVRAGAAVVGASPGTWRRRIYSVVAGMGTRDCAAGFRAYSAAFLGEVKIEGRSDPEVALELVVKAREMGRPIEDVPLARPGPSPGPGGIRWYLRGLWGGKASGFTGGAHPAIYILAVAVLWSAFLTIPNQVASVELDPSWQQVMAHARVHSLQAGKDILFTQIPLGYLRSQVYERDLFTSQILIMSVLHLLMAIWICRAGFERGGIVRIILFLLACLCLLTEDVRVFLAAALVSRSLAEEPGMPPGRAVVGIGFLACISLMKFTFFIFAGLAIVVIAATTWFSHRRRAVGVIGGYLLLWLLCWGLAGQSPLNIPSHIRASLEMAMGYSEAMALAVRPQTDLVVAASILGLWAVALALGVFRRPFRPPRASVAELYMAIAFLLWKNSFARHDLHALAFFSMASVLPFLSWPRLDPVRWRARVRAGLLIGAIGLAVVMFLDVVRGIGWTAQTVLGRASRQVQVNLTCLARVRQHRHNLEKGREALAAHHALPGVAAIVGGGSVDMVSAWRQGVLLLNGFHYAPRPVFQSYAAITPDLLERNADHFASRDGPEYVLTRMEAMDGRHPAMEDGMALKRILRHYVPAYHEKGYLLLRRVDDSFGGGDVQERVLLEKTVRFGEAIDLREHADRILTLAVDLRKTPSGKVRKTLIRAPRVNLEVRGPSGMTSFRIIPGMIRSGFLIQPSLRTLPDLLLCYRRPSGWPLEARVDSVALSLEDPADASSFDPEIPVRIAEYPPSGICPGSGEVPFLDAEIRERVSPGTGRYILGEAGEYLVEAHAPATLSIPLPEKAGALTVSYGILTPESLDGVEFRISMEAEGGEKRTLWSRHLDPRRRQGDGAMQTVEVALVPTGGEASRVLLETLVGPDGDGSWDLAYWADLEFIPR